MFTTEDDTENSEEELNATDVSDIDMIVKSLWNIRVFFCGFLMDYSQESFADDESVLPDDMLRIFLINRLSHSQPLWENNETEEEIIDTITVLATEIDISAIFRYEGDSSLTKYRLVSMVCSHGDLYNCVAYENNRWVRHTCSEIEVVGDWDGVLSILLSLHIQPKILFFENAMQMVSRD